MKELKDILEYNVEVEDQQDKEIIEKLANKVLDKLNDKDLVDKVHIMTISKCIKINDQEMYDMIICNEDSNISPNFHLQKFINHMKSDDNTEESDYDNFVDSIIEAFEYSMNTDNTVNDIQLDELQDLDKVRDMIFPRLISRKHNIKFLDKCPYALFGSNLAMIFYIEIPQKDEDDDSIYSIKVTDTLMDSFGINLKELIDIAIDNISSSNQMKFGDLCTVITRMMDISEEDAEVLKDADPGLFIVTNEQGHYGSAYLSSGALVEEMAKNLNSSIIIIPSSLHELLIIKADSNNIDECQERIDEVKEMVYQINREHVADSDILCDGCFFYDYENKVLYEENGLRIPFFD